MEFINYRISHYFQQPHSTKWNFDSDTTDNVSFSPYLAEFIEVYLSITVKIKHAKRNFEISWRCWKHMQMFVI